MYIFVLLFVQLKLLSIPFLINIMFMFTFKKYKKISIFSLLEVGTNYDLFKHFNVILYLSCIPISIDVNYKSTDQLVQFIFNSNKIPGV